MSLRSIIPPTTPSAHERGSRPSAFGLTQNSAFGLTQNSAFGLIQNSAFGLTQNSAFGLIQNSAFGLIQNSAFGLTRTKPLASRPSPSPARGAVSPHQSDAP